jgi:hypothetical protein
MLLHKELAIVRVESSELNNGDEGGVVWEDSVENGGSVFPTSLTRAFALHYLDWLPSAEELSEGVLKEFVHYLVLRLLKFNLEKEMMEITMAGTTEYCSKLRSWQALCLLAEYCGGEIGVEVAELLYKALKCFTHGAIRYYIECFAVKCLRSFPEAFAPALLRTLSSIDCTPQVQSSLLVITGYGVLGLDGIKDKVRKHLDVEKVVQATTPWLASTQGFSRGAAQLLLFELIPEAMAAKEGSGGGDMFYLEALYKYLKENSEMVKLRVKCVKFFEKLDVDSLCTVQGLLGVSHDDQEDPLPETLLDVLKNCMKTVYDEGHVSEINTNVPVWKYAEGMKAATEGEEGEEDGEEEGEGDGGMGTFQRKILTFDSLNIAASTHLASMNNNAAGVVKHDLILCASLIDKPPNLGGLARTVEIFGMKKLVMPDLKIKKMDNFQATSVSAEQWIECEECKEDVSKRRARAKREEKSEEQERRDVHMIIILLIYQDL